MCEADAQWPTCHRPGCLKTAKPGVHCDRRDCPWRRELEPPGPFVRQLVIANPTEVRQDGEQSAA